MNTEERIELITRNLQEVITEKELRNLLDERKSFSLYWGTMPTGSVSFAYFFPMLKIADFLKAGVKVKILLADLHALLDGVSPDILEKRYKYYKRAITLILSTIGVNLKNLEFVKGSDIELNGKYFNDLLKLSTLTTINSAKHSASEAVKTARGDVKLSGLIYPLMQALDEVYLDVDAQFAGLDQRKILVYDREYLPKIGYNPKIELMTPMIRGLIGKQMSSSIASSKIDLLDDEKTVGKKVSTAEFSAGNSENGIMDILKYLIFIMKEDNGQTLVIERPEKYGGRISYQNYEELKRDVLAKKLHPSDVKNTVAKEINFLLEKFREDKEIHQLYKEAYPLKK